MRQVFDTEKGALAYKITRFWLIPSKASPQAVRGFGRRGKQEVVSLPPELCEGEQGPAVFGKRGSTGNAENERGRSEKTQRTKKGASRHGRDKIWP